MNKKKEIERGLVFKFSVIFLFALFFSGLLVLAAELSVRFYYRDVLSTADGTSYFSLKNQHLFAAEENGFRLRGKQFKEIADERYRLLVSGDSFTWGQGVYPAEKRFTDRLDVLLSTPRHDPGIEVVNVGICGFNLPNHYKFLHFIDAVHPDYVLYQWFINDMTIHPDYAQYKVSHLIKNKMIHTFLWKHSALYYLLQRGYGSLQRKNGTKKTYEQYLQDSMSDPASKLTIDAKTLLEKLIDHYKKKNTDFGIVLFPTFVGPMDSYSMDFLHDQVLDVCREKDIQCLDLREAYRTFDNKSLWANVFDPHPGILAHKIAADEIYKAFGPYWQAEAEKNQFRNGSKDRREK